MYRAWKRALETEGLCEDYLGEDRGLASKLFQDLGSSSKSITRLTDTDVQAELVDDHIPHGVGILVLLGFGHFLLSVRSK